LLEEQGLAGIQTKASGASISPGRLAQYAVAVGFPLRLCQPA
jgi:hypothetical protein